MDPSSIAPPPTFTAAPTAVPAPFLQPNNHVAVAANANPSSAPAPNHPPYAEMIRTAITTLNERNGSSKRAISKYIEQAYPNLPSTHPTLLTQHLNRLKTNGLLVMVKKSYRLPRSDAASTSTAHRRPGPGRPPKRKPNTVPQPQPNANPVWLALGLEDEPTIPEATRGGPGPSSNTGTNIVDQPGPSARRGRPPGSKRPGRPPKPKPDSPFSNGPKRRPGRPPKNQTNVTVIPFAPPDAAIPAEAATAGTVPAVQPDTGAPLLSPRSRGRPKKSAAAVPPLGAAPQAVGAGPAVRLNTSVPLLSPRSRGRPKKNVAAVPPSGAAPQAVGAGPSPGRGHGRGRGRGRGQGLLPGRPPKVAGVKSVGRPKKGTSVEVELRRKLQYFQSKVNESLGVIKPHFNLESPVSAIAAIQELEILAAMDLSVSLRDETQELPAHASGSR